jgi:M6 family metalloprotease-like protein
MYTRSLGTAAAVALAVLGCQNEPTAPRAEIPLRAASASRPLEGWLHTLWVHPVGGNGPETVRYELVDERGHGTELELKPGLAARWGGPPGVKGRKVRVEGSPVDGGRLRVRSIEPAAGATAAQASTVQIGPHPFVTVLCKFSDIAEEPYPMATYIKWTTGTTYPSLDHYWRELSYNQMNVSGSIVVGWYTLPYPLSHYVPGDGTVDISSMAADCTSAADPDVDFTRFWGINQQFNGSFGFSAGTLGPTWTLTADGQTKKYAMTWLYPWNSLADYAHEDGHTLGLPHSNGWDIMRHGSGIPSCGLGIPLHTISWNKDVLGWIPAARKLTVEPNTSRTITLERLALPGSGNYLMAQIPMENAPGQFYTVEVRRRAGYDDCLPGDAAILYQVNPSSHSQPAQMVDGDGNGNLLDAGAMWTPGETFTDAANGITVRVNAQTATGFQVTITRRRPNTWVSRTPMARARTAFALTAAGGLLYAVGGRTSDGSILASVEAYNPASNRWTGKAAVPSPRHDGNGATVNSGKLYLPGGRNSANALIRTLYVYNVSTNTWGTKASLPIRSGCGGSVFVNGLLYVLTGCDATSGYKGRLHRYSPSSNTWAVRATAPAAHGYPAVGVINGKLYVAGGRNAAGSATAALHVYDPGSNLWSTKAAMPSPRWGAAGQVINGKLYVVGGTNASGDPLGVTLVYNPVTNLWSTKAPMPTRRTRLAAGVINNLLYAVGGRVTTALTKVERYTP